MLEIKAKSDATIDVIDGAFPLGLRNTIKINIEDDNIKQYIKTIGTDTCIQENNLFSYGNFNYFSDIDNLQLNLNMYSSAVIAPGYGHDYSGCLYCKSEDEKDGLGTVTMIPDKSKLEIGKDYTLSCYVNITENTDLYFDISGTLVNPTQQKDKWVFFTHKFTAESEDFSLSFVLPSTGEFYVDSVQLFLSDQEIIDNYYDNLKFSVDILNPCQTTIIDRVVNYSKPDNESVYVILYLPEITTVDFQDNLLCKLRISLLQEQRDKYLGQSEYNKIEECVYNSQEFILNGYMLPPDSGEYELVVGSI